MAKAILIVALFLGGVFALFAPTPQKQKAASSFLYSNPLISKAALGVFSPFVADFAWLESTKIGEMGKGGTYNVNKNEFRLAFMTIASLDPHFFHATNYGSSFLFSIHKDKISAFDIIDRARLQNKDDFRLLYLKLIMEVTDQRPDKKVLKELAMQVFTHPDFKGVFGVMKVDDFLIEILSFAGDEGAKTKQLKDELEWLYKNTKDEKKKQLIATKLKELK